MTTPTPTQEKVSCNTLWLVQETLIHRMKWDERRQAFDALAALRQPRSPTSSPGKEASGA